MSDTVTFYDCMVVASTERALLVEMPDGEEVWFPRSQIVYGETDIEHKNDVGTLEVTEWIAKAKGLR